MSTPTVHNPENVPPSAVPPGWRIRTQQEALVDPPEGTPFRLWDNHNSKFWNAEPHTHFRDTLEKDWTVLYPEDFHLPDDPLHALPDTAVTHTVQVSRKIIHMSATPETADDYSEILVLCDDGTWWRIFPNKDNPAWKQLNLPRIPQH
jgi:hypothetical protein